MPRRPPTKRSKRQSTFHKILHDLDEESASEEDFESVSTDNQATNYNLEYTGQSLKSVRRSRESQAAPESPKQTTPLKSALKRASTTYQESSNISERLRHRSEQSAQTPSPSKNTSRVRFSLIDKEGSDSEDNEDREEERTPRPSKRSEKGREEERTPRQSTRISYDSGQKRSNKNLTEQPGTSGRHNQPERRTRSSPSRGRSMSGDDDSEPEESARQATRKADESDRRRSTRNVTDQEPSTSRSQSKPERRPRKQKSPKKKQTTNALREIRRLQQAVDLLIPKLPFARVIRETLMQHSDMGMRITLVALEALQEAAELYLVQLFEDSYRCTQHRNRVTLTVKDMELVRFLRGPSDPGSFA